MVETITEGSTMKVFPMKSVKRYGVKLKAKLKTMPKNM
jgi:hypothetical protein